MFSGTIEGTVTGRREYSADLPQGGLEIPCSLVFKAIPKEILKLKKMWKNNGFSHLYTVTLIILRNRATVTLYYEIFVIKMIMKINNVSVL